MRQGSRRRLRACGTSLKRMRSEKEKRERRTRVGEKEVGGGLDVELGVREGVERFALVEAHLHERADRVLGHLLALLLLLLLLHLLLLGLGEELAEEVGGTRGGDGLDSLGTETDDDQWRG